MKVFNKTRKITLSRNAIYLKSFLGRMRGLMLSGKKDAILDSGRDDAAAAMIHMLLMRYPIDVAWINSKMIVVDVKKKIRPFNPFCFKTWGIYGPKRPARFVVELGLGELGTTEIGDEIKFI